jgi:hypothetical protein
MGHASVTRAQLAAKAGWKAKGSHLRNRLSELRTGDLIEYRSDAIALTPAGNAVAAQPDLGVSLVDSIRAALNGPQREVFNTLLELGLGGPAVFSRDELAERLGWDAGRVALTQPTLRARRHGDRGLSGPRASRATGMGTIEAQRRPGALREQPSRPRGFCFSRPEDAEALAERFGGKMIAAED